MNKEICFRRTFPEILYKYYEYSKQIKKWNRKTNIDNFKNIYSDFPLLGIVLDRLINVKEIGEVSTA